MAGGSVSLTVRVPAGLLGRVEACAADRGVSKARVVVAALEGFFEDARGGVVDLAPAAEEVLERARVPGPGVLPRSVSDADVVRQRLLNRAKGL